MGLICMESWELEQNIEILKVRCNYIDNREQDMIDLAKSITYALTMMTGQIERMQKDIKNLEKRIEKVESK